MINNKIKKILRPSEIQEIIFLSAEKNYTNFHFKNGSIKKFSTNLGKIESEFCNNLELMRIHLSYIVNINYISEVHKIEGFVKLFNKRAIPISTKYSDMLEKIELNVN